MNTSIDSDLQNVINSLQGAYSDATIRGYKTDVFDFVAWCASSGYQSFPAKPEAVSEYLDALASKGLNPRTLERRLYAIRKFHGLMKLDDPTRVSRVQLTFRKIKRASFARPQQAAALTRQDLDKILDGKPDTPAELRNRLIISLGFDLLARRSEIVALTDDDVSPADKGTYSFLIRRSKADPFGAGRIAFCSPRSARLLEDWWEWRGNATSWLFCPIYNDQPIDRSICGTTVRRAVKQAMIEIGKSQAEARLFSGHSMRVGAAQDLLKRGQDTAGIMRAGGWKSIKVLSRYLETAEHNPWV